MSTVSYLLKLKGLGKSQHCQKGKKQQQHNMFADILQNAD